MPLPWSIDQTQAQLEHTSRKNVANGYAGLDGVTKLDGQQQRYGTVANTACEGNDPRLSGGSQATILKLISFRG